MRHDCTVKSTPPFSLRLTLATASLPLTNIISCVIMCAHCHPSDSYRYPPNSKRVKARAGCADAVGCHAVSSVGVSVAVSVAVRRKTASLLTSSVCLTARLIAGVCTAHGTERRRLSWCTPTPTSLILLQARPKQMCIHAWGFSMKQTHTLTPV